MLSTVAERAGRGAPAPAAALADGVTAAYAVAAVAVLAVGFAAAWAFRTRDLTTMTTGPATLLAG